MKKILFLVILALPLVGFSRDAARDLRRLVGYTIIKADYVSDAIEGRSGVKLLKLSDGTIWKVDLLLLTPLVTTDVIFFAKKLSPEIIAKMPPKTPEARMYLIKLLIDNEVFDAVQVE
jgi:hypothetical protein